MSNEARLPKEVQSKIDRVEELEKQLYGSQGNASQASEPALDEPKLPDVSQPAEPTPTDQPKAQDQANQEPKQEPEVTSTAEKMDMPEAVADGEDLSKRLEKEIARNRTAIGRLNKAQSDLATAQKEIRELKARAPTSDNAEMKKLSEQVATLTAQLAESRTAKPAQQPAPQAEPPHIANYRKEYGDEVADAMLAQWQETQQLKGQFEGVNNSVSELKAKDKAASEHDRRVNDLTQKLTADGIDFNALNNDAGFNNWLSYQDPKHGGQSYRDIMLANLDNGKIDATAEFFREYHHASQNHVPQTPAPQPTPKPSLDDRVTQQPTPSGNAAHIESNPVYSPAQIQQFYSNFERAQREARSTGDYSKVDAMALEEKKIEAALVR